MTNRNIQPPDENLTAPPQDELDALLRQWHDENRLSASASRDRLFGRLREEVHRQSVRAHETRAAAVRIFLWRLIMHRYTRYAATLSIAVALVAILLPLSTQQTHAETGVVMLPDGGRLDAFDDRGQLIGPCPLKHTDVNVQIAGHFSRVTVTQTYHNTYDGKIEAVYTFPLSHRAAVDRMTMTIGDRVIEGEVKERQLARQVYEAARDQGYVASLLEQERPNIFTQSVANIEPGAEVIVEISYVEILQFADGEYRFDFPMVVAPRYIPGRPAYETLLLPEGLEARRGVILLGPAELRAADDKASPQQLHALLHGAAPINEPAERWSGRDARMRLQFTASYPRITCGTRGQCIPSQITEQGALYTDGTGHLAGRWFFYDASFFDPRHGFAPDTDQVPDASRITPMPVRPEVRAGHDIAVTVTIDTGGPALRDISSGQHKLTTKRDEGKPGRAMMTLAKGRDIPNRDFLLTWSTASDRIEEAVFTHTGEYGDYTGGFFTLILQPPDRIEDEMVRPRELIFVLDQSGSMTGARLERSGMSALDAAKMVISQAIDTMRPDDRFNIVSFNNSLDVLWPEAQANTEANRAEAQRYIARRQGGGGTEMRNAVLKALEAGPFARQDRPQMLSPLALADLPADGRRVQLKAPLIDIHVVDDNRYRLRVQNDLWIDLRLLVDLPTVLRAEGVDVKLAGRWATEGGRRLLIVEQTEMLGLDADDEPMRIVLFVTDGLVGNDDAIIQAVRENAHRTRVFTIGMSRAPNRYLLDEMARAGRGAVDYALPDDDVEPIVARFAQRIATPVLTDIALEFDGLEVVNLLPGAGRLPDLFDMEPLVIHGRYAEPGRGTLTIRGRTGGGLYERTLDLELPEQQPDHDVIATLWARAQVGELSRENDVPGIVALGEAFQIMTQHTSFVAVEKQRVTIDGKPVLVRVPIEFPEGMSWEGVFGERGAREARPAVAERWAAPPPTSPMSIAPGTEMQSEPILSHIRGRSQMPSRPNADHAPAVDRSAPYRYIVQDAANGRGAGGDAVGGVIGTAPMDELLRREVHGIEGFPELRWEHDGFDRLARALLHEGKIEELQVMLQRILSLDAENAEARALHDLIERQLATEAAAGEGNAMPSRELFRRLHWRLILMLDADPPRQAIVSVLVQNIGDETLDALREAGLDIQHTSERGPFVIGRIATDRLEALAMLDQVRRVELIDEPTRQ